MIHIILSVLFDVIVYNYLSWKVACKINTSFRNFFRELKCIKYCKMSIKYALYKNFLSSMRYKKLKSWKLDKWLLRKI